jgi:hypothetical protein
MKIMRLLFPCGNRLYWQGQVRACLHGTLPQLHKYEGELRCVPERLRDIVLPR